MVSKLIHESYSQILKKLGQQHDKILSKSGKKTCTFSMSNLYGFWPRFWSPRGRFGGVFGRPFGLQKMVNRRSQSEFEEKLDFGAIWGRFGRGLEAQGAPFGRSLGALGELGGVFGTLLGASWCLWGVLLALLGSSWSSLGRS